MPLHIDYRPENFDEVIGNAGVIESLKTKIKSDDRPHSYIFQGPSGCGKTTIARILASEFGCPEFIDKKTNTDFMEINASNNRGIDTAREIMSNIHYRPTMADCRVFILDEVHMTTKDFQNALLKALEDTPPHVYFMLCTTEPEKLLKTIRNRCSVYEVKSLSHREMEDLLVWVSEETGINLPNDVMQEIADVSDGCPRQALVTFDQIIELPEDRMLNAVIATKIDEKEIKELCQALLKEKKWKEVSGIIQGLKSTDPEKIRQAVIHYMKAVALNGGPMTDRAALIFDCFREPVFYTGMAGITFNAYNSLI